jgi:hypothetical protein
VDENTIPCPHHINIVPEIKEEILLNQEVKCLQIKLIKSKNLSTNSF